MLDFVKWQKITKYANEDTISPEYFQQILGFAERWAHLMDEQISQGETVEHIAEATSYLAEVEATYGITLIMYQQAVQKLVYAWDRGEELRVWHNKRFDDDPVKPGLLLRCDAVQLPDGKVVAITAAYGALRTAGTAFWRTLKQQVAEQYSE